MELKPILPSKSFSLSYIFPKLIKLLILLNILNFFGKIFFLIITRIFYKIETKNKKDIRFIITNSPSHFNYGDEAILKSTQEFLKFYFPYIEQILIYNMEVLNNFRLVKYIIKKTDIIRINGGGYYGLYKNTIKAQTYIVESFPNNYIIFFPCSIYNNPKKNNEFSMYLEKFNNHKKLTLFTRESISYKTALNLFRTKEIFNVPDIVTRLNINFLEKKN